MSKITLDTHVLKIDRVTPFEQLDVCSHLKSSVGQIHWQDERSLALTEIDIDTIQLVTMLKTNENGINGYERIRRIKDAGYVMLDLRIFFVICQNRIMAERLLRRVRTKEPKPHNLVYEYGQNKPHVCFDGTICRISNDPESTVAFGPPFVPGGPVHTLNYPIKWGPWDPEAPSAVLIPK